MYKQIQNLGGEIWAVRRIADNAWIPFDPANTDYQAFKADLAKGVELQDAEGITMTTEQIQTFVGTLP